MTCLPGGHKESVTLHTPATTTDDGLGNVTPATFTDSTKSVIVFDRDYLHAPGVEVLENARETLLYVEYADFPTEASRSYPLNFYRFTVRGKLYQVSSVRRGTFTSTVIDFWKINIERIDTLTQASYSYADSPVYTRLVSLHDYLETAWTTYAQTITGPFGGSLPGTSKPMVSMRPIQISAVDYAGQWVSSSAQATSYEVRVRIAASVINTATQASRVIHALQEHLNRADNRATIASTYAIQILDCETVTSAYSTTMSSIYHAELEMRFLCDGTQITVPGAPTALTLEEDLGTSIELSWTAPSSTGGSAITVYTIYRGTVSGTLTAIGTSATAGYTDTTASEYVEYYYAVTASNHVGEGSQSSELALEVPETPATPSLVDVDLSWVAPTSSSPIIGLQCIYGSDNPPTQYTASLNIALVTLNITTLVSLPALGPVYLGIRYQSYRGWSTLSTAAEYDTVPAAVSDLAEDSWDEYDVTVTWTDPADGGDTITGVNVYVDGVFDQTVSLGVQTATITVSAGATVAITVKAENAKGEASTSNIITVVAPVYVETFTVTEPSWSGTPSYSEVFA